MSTMPTNYKHPLGGAYNETIAIFADGRKATVNTQYGAVILHGHHADDCDQLNKIGGRCTCPHNADIMAASAEIVDDARANGKTGYEPEKETAPEPVINPDYAHMTRDEIAAAERKYDAVHNEGGEGYNPYRDNLYVTGQH